ncbi:MAG: ABC transporter ATP-binding protein [Cyanobacteria bacterium J06621_12]
MFHSSANVFLSDLIKAKPASTLSLLCLSLFSTACNVVGTTLLIPIISILIGHDNQFSFKYWELISRLLDDFTAPQRLGILLITLSLIILLKNIADYGAAVIGFKYLQALVYDLKSKGLEMLCLVDFNYYRQHKTGDILLKLNREIDRTSLAIKSIHKILTISITIAILLVILIIISWQLTLVTLVTLKITSLINSWLGHKTNQMRMNSSAATQGANRQIVEFLSGIRLIKTVSNETQACQEISQAIAAKDRQQLKTQLVFSSIKPVSEMGGMVLVLILTIASYYLYSSPITAITPLFLVYLVVLFRLLPFISQFTNAKQQYIKTRASINTVANFLGRDNKLSSNSGKLDLVKLKTGIEFKAVTFAYPNHGQIVLDKISLRIPQGKAIALVGFPGTGNFTIADLLTRFYEPIGGKILLDSKELSEYNTHSLRQAIAVISHSTFIFNISLADNIAYGIPHATEQDIVAAAQKAKIYQFIVRLPAGLATKVGERGIKLSELQKQKISLARAFLRNPEIVILDEPFSTLEPSGLDFPSFKDGLQNLCRGRTTVIVTRQLELAQIADQVAIFSQGRITEMGTHHQLLQEGKVYPKLYSTKFKLDQQSRQLKLAQRIARKLAQHNSGQLSESVQTNFDSLLNYLEIINQGWFKNDSQEEVILDQSFQSAKNMLQHLREYGQNVLEENED